MARFLVGFSPLSKKADEAPLNSICNTISFTLHKWDRWENAIFQIVRPMENSTKFNKYNVAVRIIYPLCRTSEYANKRVLLICCFIFDPNFNQNKNNNIFEATDDYFAVKSTIKINICWFAISILFKCNVFNLEPQILYFLIFHGILHIIKDRQFWNYFLTFIKQFFFI